MKKRVIGIIICSMILVGCSEGEYGDLKVYEEEMIVNSMDAVEYCDNQRFEGDVRYYYEYNCPMCDTNNNEKHKGLWNKCCYVTTEYTGEEGELYCTEEGYYRIELVGDGSGEYYFYNESGELVKRGKIHEE